MIFSNPEKKFCVACKGLADPLVGAPLERLVLWLHGQTGTFFHVVGGVDPHPLFEPIMQTLMAAHGRGEQIVFLGHSMGGMAAFYAADRLKALGIRSPLFIAIDATNWGSNAPGVPPWTTPATTPPAGHWYVPDNVDEWLYFRQPAGPGGGLAFLAPDNKTTRLISSSMMDQTHIGIVNNETVKVQILEALRGLK